MSKPACKPHLTKVYHYEGEGENMRLVLKETTQFPSKAQAERYASQMRKFHYVSSAVVEPVETYKGIQLEFDVALDGGGA